MGDFDEHFSAGKKYALAAIIISSVITHQMGLSTRKIILTALVAAGFGLLTSLLPDIDHQDSKPRRAVGKYTSIAIIGAVLLLPAMAPDFVNTVGRLVWVAGISGDPSMLGSGVILIGGVAAIAFGGDLFDNSTTHRGFTHSFAFAFFVGIASFFSLGFLMRVFPQLYFLSGEAGVVVALIAAGGVFVHLSVDGIV